MCSSPDSLFMPHSVSPSYAAVVLSLLRSLGLRVSRIGIRPWHPTPHSPMDLLRLYRR